MANVELLVWPLIAINVWHALVIVQARHESKLRNSISESATNSPAILLAHQAVHFCVAIGLFLYAVQLVSSPGLVVPGIFLSLAAILDVVQVITLNKNTVHTPLYFRDVHQFAAWVMTMSFLFFTLLFAVDKHLPMREIVILIAILLCLYAASTRVGHKHYWLWQMCVFVSISVMMVRAGIA